MAKYLWQVSYEAEGVKGLKVDGAAARRAVAQKLVEQAGGRLESFYYAMGEWDLYAIVDLPDTTTAMALSLAVNASGALRLRTVPLLTVDEMDAVTKTSVDYRPPGAGRK